MNNENKDFYFKHIFLSNIKYLLSWRIFPFVIIEITYLQTNKKINMKDRWTPLMHQMHLFELLFLVKGWDDDTWSLVISFFVFFFTLFSSTLMENLVLKNGGQTTLTKSLESQQTPNRWTWIQIQNSKLHVCSKLSLNQQKRLKISCIIFHASSLRFILMWERGQNFQLFWAMTSHQVKTI